MVVVRAVPAAATGTRASPATAAARRQSLSAGSDQSLFPRKFSGVTRTIATACETILPHPSQSRNTSEPELVHGERDQGDDEEARPW